MEELEKIRKENDMLRKKIKLYETSSKLDYVKIEKLKDELIKYKQLYSVYINK